MVQLIVSLGNILLDGNEFEPEKKSGVFYFNNYISRCHGKVTGHNPNPLNSAE